jgi:hypothetical protein
MHRPGLISIWFFIGTLLLLYGIIIFATGLSELGAPPPVVLANLHAPLWWGILLIALGAFYFIRFGPWHKS